MEVRDDAYAHAYSSRIHIAFGWGPGSEPLAISIIICRWWDRCDCFHGFCGDADCDAQHLKSECF